MICAVPLVVIMRTRKPLRDSLLQISTDAERRSKLIAAVNHENWQPNEHSWLCSEHFVLGEKSNNLLAPNYIPTLFSHVESPVKLKMVAKLDDFNRRQAMKRRRVENEPSLTVDEVEQTQCCHYHLLQ